MQNHDCRDYSIRNELPDFDAYNDGLFQALVMPLEDGRYVVVTDLDGMNMPSYGNFNVCVYRSEEAFWDDPMTGIIASATSDNFENVDLALAAVEVAT